ncbi:MAG: DNA repair protein RecN [Syntrophales bacterium]|nr:DNA repair protein RecN [Syntrophales bacterium]
MLKELSIRNFAIIDELRVAFAEGLNILTGETGAGKSIIIGAVNLLLGDRASGDMIRTSQDSANVEALFDIQGKEDVASMLRGWGIDDGDDLVVKRIISRSGKNRVYINGHAATLGMLSALGESLMNICGQHEHQLMLREENHLDILDEFAGLKPLRQEYASIYKEVELLRERLGSLESLNKRKGDRQEFLRFQIDEIKTTDPKIGEDDALIQERKILVNAQKLSDLASMAHDQLYSGEGALLEKLKVTMDAIRDIHRIDARLPISEEDFASHYYQIEEAAFLLRDYVKGLSFDPSRIEVIDDRLESFAKIKRKHGGTIDAVLMKKEEMEIELRQMLSIEEEIEELSKSLNSTAKMMEDKAIRLSAARRDAALELQKAIEVEIHTLRMAGARFELLFRDNPVEGNGERFGPSGMDSMAFYLSTNQGEDIKPLSRVASGGELSRVVLAMKKVLAGTGFSGTIVFDEVDSGIGGATAEIVGEKIREVSRRHQVLCITHLPQIACFGIRHYSVKKRIHGEKTVTSVDILSEEERLEEMARMLGGVEVTETTRIHAREMLAVARRNLFD